MESGITKDEGEAAILNIIWRTLGATNDLIQGEASADLARVNDSLGMLQSGGEMSLIGIRENVLEGLQSTGANVGGVLEWINNQGGERGVIPHLLHQMQEQARQQAMQPSPSYSVSPNAGTVTERRHVYP